MTMNVLDYRYQWAKGLARKLTDEVEKHAEQLNDSGLIFEHLLIKNILEYTYSTSN